MIYKNRLLALRERLGLTQKQLGIIIETKEDAYRHYESEDYLMPTKHLNSICNYFNISFDYIFEFTDKKQYNHIKQDINLITSGKRLKELRKENKLTQTKLAQILNTTRTVISGYEVGRYLIAIPFLYTISKKYNISADYLLGKIDSPKYLK